MTSKTIFAYLRDSGGPAQERSVPKQRQAPPTWADEQGLSHRPP
jgi:hypothetical protein